MTDYPKEQSMESKKPQRPIAWLKIEANPLIIPLHRWIELGLIRGI